MSHEGDPIPVCWLSREDLVACRPDLADRLETLPDPELASLADRLGDALQETYWLALTIILDNLVQPEPAREKDMPNDAEA